MPIQPHELKAGIDVYSSDGQKLGNLHRAVLRRSDLMLTHVVVDIGFLRSGRHIWEGGVGLDYDRVVPIDAVASSDNERLNLTLSAADFKDAPEYTEERYATLDTTPNEFDVEDVANRLQVIADGIASVPNVWIAENLNKSVDSVDIIEGTPVWRREPHQKVGEVKRLMFDASGSAQALVIQRGFLLHRDVVLPVRYIAELLDDIVRIDISDGELEKLQGYKEA